MNPQDQRQDGDGEDTMQSIRDTIELATEDLDLSPFTETVEDKELDELLGSSGQSDANAGAEDTSGTSTDAPRGMGIDKIFQEVSEKIGPEAAQVVKDLQAEYTRSRQELAQERGLREELNSKFDAVNERLDVLDREPAGADEEYPDLSAAITDDHRVLFRLMLKELGPDWAAENGYMKAGDLEDIKNQEKAVSARQTELGSAIETGIKRYGNSFGHRDSNNVFVLNPEAKASMEVVYERLARNLPRGVSFPGTVLDIFEITFGGDESAKLNGERNRIDRLSGLGSVANGSSNGTSNLGWYKEGESLSKTIRKASALSSREIGS